MTFGQLAYLLRWAAGLGLLALGLGCASLCLLLYWEGIGNTEGSPAATLIFAIGLAAALGAPLLIGAGSLICLRLWRRGAPARLLPAERENHPPPKRGEIWRQAENGDSMGALFNGGRAVLLWIPAAGDMQHSRGSAESQSTLIHPFVNIQGDLLKLPHRYTVPEALALRELDHFARCGERSPALGWNAAKRPSSALPELWSDIWSAGPDVWK